MMYKRKYKYSSRENRDQMSFKTRKFYILNEKFMKTLCIFGLKQVNDRYFILRLDIFIVSKNTRMKFTAGLTHVIRQFELAVLALATRDYSSSFARCVRAPRRESPLR